MMNTSQPSEAYGINKMFKLRNMFSVSYLCPSVLRIKNVPKMVENECGIPARPGKDNTMKSPAANVRNCFLEGDPDVFTR